MFLFWIVIHVTCACMFMNFVCVSVCDLCSLACARVCAYTGVKKRGSQISCCTTVQFVPVRQDLPLNLELGWWPSSPMILLHPSPPIPTVLALQHSPTLQFLGGLWDLSSVSHAKNQNMPHCWEGYF